MLRKIKYFIRMLKRKRKIVIVELEKPIIKVEAHGYFTGGEMCDYLLESLNRCIVATAKSSQIPLDTLKQTAITQIQNFKVEDPNE